LRHQTMDKVQKHNAFNTNTPSLESYKYYKFTYFVKLSVLWLYSVE